MSNLSLEKLVLHRQETFCLKPGDQLRNLQQAAAFVKKRGFVYFWPIKGIELPNLWTAVAGSRPVANEHDDPGHITWQWKDDSLGKHYWYYGKILRKRATLIDLEIAPFFYALSKNYGNPEEDIFIQYNDGHLTLEAKNVFETILRNGPMDTVEIRRATHMISRQSNSRFERAMALLQSDFKIAPIGISNSGGWRYAFIYELVHRYYPKLLIRARLIQEEEAQEKLASLYFESVGAAQLRDVSRLYQWRKTNIQKTLDRLVEIGFLCAGVNHPQASGDWYALKKLVH